MTAPQSPTREQVEELFQRSKEQLPPFAVAFVREDNAQREPRLAGSGTLVIVDGVHGILTAHHVMSNLPATGEVGLMFSRYPESGIQRPMLEMELTGSVLVAGASGDERGPDLGFLSLPSHTVANLKARASFYDLTNHRDRVLREPWPVEAGRWLLMGAVDEWTSTGPGQSGYTYIRNFHMLCGGSAVSREEQRDGFDYLHFEVKCDGVEGRPDSYEGVSGGSLWQVIQPMDDEPGTVGHAVLSGVPFYQTPMVDLKRTIVCHGRRSVYGAVVDAVRAAYNL